MATNLPRLSEEEIARKLAGLPGWKREAETLVKEFVFAGFSEAAGFPAKIAPLANNMDHHPDVQIYRYRRVKIILTTHSAGGITQNDFDLANKIDGLA